MNILVLVNKQSKCVSMLNYIRKISSKTSHKDKYFIISTAAVRSAYFDGFQIVAVSFSAEFSFSFCCFVFDVKQRNLKKIIHTGGFSFQ